jgi:hypothetical protein
MDSVPFFIAPTIGAIGLIAGAYYFFRGIKGHNKAYQNRGAIILAITIVGFAIYYTALIYIGFSIKS